MTETTTKHPDIVYRDGKPAAVILSIDEYEELLERVEDAEDIAYLRKLRTKPMRFVGLEELLKERPVGV